MLLMWGGFALISIHWLSTVSYRSPATHVGALPGGCRLSPCRALCLPAECQPPQQSTAPGNWGAVLCAVTIISGAKYFTVHLNSRLSLALCRALKLNSSFISCMINRLAEFPRGPKIKFVFSYQNTGLIAVMGAAQGPLILPHIPASHASTPRAAAGCCCLSVLILTSE